jgi:hypothetical protein
MLLIPIPIRIRQNDADPTWSRSRSTTLIIAVQYLLQLVRAPNCRCSLGAPGFIRTYCTVLLLSFDVRNSKFLVPFLFIFPWFLYFLSRPFWSFH